MSHRFLLKVFLASIGLFGALTTAVQGKEPPECYIIDNSGKLTDLTDICNVGQKRSPQTDAAASSEPQSITNISVSDPNLQEAEFALDDNQYILGKRSVTTDSGAISSVYYIDNAIGADYAAYVRRYKTAPTSLTRQTLRENIFQFNSNESTSERLTSILRDGREVPFIIYRY